MFYNIYKYSLFAGHLDYLVDFTVARLQNEFLVYFMFAMRKFLSSSKIICYRVFVFFQALVGYASIVLRSPLTAGVVLSKFCCFKIIPPMLEVALFLCSQ